MSLFCDNYENAFVIDLENLILKDTWEIIDSWEIFFSTAAVNLVASLFP